MKSFTINVVAAATYIIEAESSRQARGKAAKLAEEELSLTNFEVEETCDQEDSK